jgi:hypothetical protein
MVFLSVHPIEWRVGELKIEHSLTDQHPVYIDHSRPPILRHITSCG